jgi:c-di-GMP-binding flagellar brake protein YcgR
MLRIVVERREEVFAVYGGAQTANELWAALWSHLPDARTMADNYPYLDAIVGRIGYIRLAYMQREVLARRMVTTRLERDGIGFVAGDEVPELLTPGLQIEVEMGNQEVVYSFRTHIARLTHHEEGSYMVIGLSSKVNRRDNRRQAFRVALEQELTLFRRANHLAETDDTALSAFLANLSWTGLAVLLEQKHPTGTLLSSSLELGEGKRQYTFEVIYTRKVHGENRILHGCRLLDLSAAQEDRIQSTVIRHQMREVQSRDLDPQQDLDEEYSLSGRPPRP